jgi:toxin YoeB
MYQIFYTNAAQKDAKKLSKVVGLQESCRKLLAIIAINPFQNPPPYEKLIGDFKGCFSRRINIQHRLIYQVFEDNKIIKVLSMWSHYE